eukprot:6696095-Prymnesium_polylepis.1
MTLNAASLGARICSIPENVIRSICRRWPACCPSDVDTSFSHASVENATSASCTGEDGMLAVLTTRCSDSGAQRMG